MFLDETSLVCPALNTVLSSFLTPNSKATMSRLIRPTLIPPVIPALLMVLAVFLCWVPPSYAGLTTPTSATTTVSWAYTNTAESVSAQGTFELTPIAGESGYLRVTGITGTRNGIQIIGLYAVDQAVPGNEGYPLDNRFDPTTSGMTKAGIGFQLADLTYVNLFYADFLDPPVIYEVYSAAPFEGLNTAAEDSEFAVAFTAVSVPEPATHLSLLLGLIGLIAGRRSTRRSR